MPTYTLPELNTKGPSFLEGLSMGENIKANRQRQSLAEIASKREQRQMDLQEKKFGIDVENQKVNSLVSIMSHAVSSASMSETDEGAQNMLKQFEGIAKRVDPTADFSGIGVKMKGADVELRLSDGTEIKGPKSKVAAMAKMYGDNPDIAKDPSAFQTLAAQNGVSIKAPDANKAYVPKTREEKLSLIEAEKKLEAKYRAPEKDSDFEKSYKEWTSKPENKGKPREEFKRVWEKPVEEHLRLLDITAKALNLDPKKPETWTKDQANAFLEKYAKDNGIAALFKLLAGTGGQEGGAGQTYDPKEGKFK